MSIVDKVKKGIYATQDAYNQRKYRQTQKSTERYRKQIADAKAKLERDRARLEDEREMLRQERELANIRLSLKQERDELARTRAASRTPKTPDALRVLGRSMASGFSSFSKWYDRQGGSDTTRSRATARKTAPKRTAKRAIKGTTKPKKRYIY